MKKSNLSSIKDRAWIFKSGLFVVVLGKKLHVFSTAGTKLFSRNDITNPCKVAFLPNDLLLVDGANKYWLISLAHGADVWVIPQPQKEFCPNFRFALSPCGKYSYDYYLNNGVYYFVRIDLEFGNIEKYAIQSGLRTTVGIQCDENGTPCLLQCHYSVIGDKRVSENGILYQYQELFSPFDDYYWKYKWWLEGSQIACSFWENTEAVLTNDLHVFYPRSGKMEYLLKNEKEWTPPALKPSAYSIEYNRFVTLKYRHSNVVIDLLERKIIAQYAGCDAGGCIVGNEFWISSESGIQRKPFPFMEDIPAVRNNFWRP